MAIKIKCSSCGAEMMAPDNASGKLGRCACGELLRLPKQAAANGGATAASAVQDTKDQSERRIPNGKALSAALPSVKPTAKRKWWLLSILPLGIVILISILVIAPKLSNYPNSPIKLVKVWDCSTDLLRSENDELGQGSDFYFLFENTSDKPVDAFQGTFSIYNKFNEVTAQAIIIYETTIPAKGKLYLNRSNSPGIAELSEIPAFRAGAISVTGDETAADLEQTVALATIAHKTVDDYELHKKYTFTCDKVVQGTDPNKNAASAVGKSTTKVLNQQGVNKNAVSAVGKSTTPALNQQGVAVNTSGQGLSLPADFPADVPIASGFKVRSKFTPPGAKGGTISLTGSDAPSTVAAYYEKEMAKQGWTQAGASADADTFTQSYTKDKRTVLFIGGGKAGQANLQITYGTQQ